MLKFPPAGRAPTFTLSAGSFTPGTATRRRSMTCEAPTAGRASALLGVVVVWKSCQTQPVPARFMLVATCST